MLRIVKLAGIGAFTLIAWWTILTSNLSPSTHIIVLLVGTKTNIEVDALYMK